MILLAFLIGGIYVLVIASFFYGWEKLQPFKVSGENKEIFVSVIIPMRNEEANICLLLQDIARQTYPSSIFEIIVVDDHSTDLSLKKAKELHFENLQILSLPTELAGKKAALSYGLQHSKGELLITTDADCRVESKWISTIVNYYQQYNPVMIIAPVIPNYHFRSIWEFGEMRSLEFFSLLGSTAGAASINHPIMCNGANLAISRSVYDDIRNIYQNPQVASGDDVFAMLALKKKYPGRIHFIKSKETSVYTEVSGNLCEFLKQRGRWTAKARFYKDFDIIGTAIVVFGCNALLLISLIYGIVQSSFQPFFIVLIIKSLIDFPFLLRVTAYYDQKKLMAWFPLVQSVYFFYVCITVLFAAIGLNAWKGRRI